jgi:hypothetical protein
MALELSVDVNVNLMMPSNAQIQAELVQAMQRSVNAVAARAKANLSGRFLKMRTGRGQRSVRSRVTVRGHDVIGTVGSPLFYLRLLHTGFPGQTLSVRSGKKAFTFFSGRHVIRLQSIQHPGVSSRPWLQTAVEESNAEILQSFGDAVLNIGRFISQPATPIPVTNPAAAPRGRTA